MIFGSKWTAGTILEAMFAADALFIVIKNMAQEPDYLGLNPDSPIC